MNSLILVGFVAFFVVALIVGIRLLWLWHRTRELPELLMGIGVLGIGPVGFGGMMLGIVAMSWNPHLANLSFAFGTLAVVSGVLAKCVFNWFVYRRRSAAAGAVTYGVTALMAIVVAMRFIDGEWAPTEGLIWDNLARTFAQVSCLLWGSLESLNYWTKMKKRQKLGLADAIVVNRFLMWGIGAGFAGVGTGIGFIAEVVTGTPSLKIPWVVSICSAMGFVSAVAIYLAFVPPARYVRYIRSLA